MIEIKRGTTPYIDIELHAIDTSEIQNVYVDIKGKNKLHLSLAKGEIEVEDNKVKIHLTQEQTLRFNKGFAKLGVRILMKDGEALALKEAEIIEFKEIVGDGVIHAED